MIVGLLDVHSMYANCEVVFRPDLRINNSAVAVASNGDGVIVACNRAAKRLGVKKFKSVVEQRHFFDTGRCTLFSSNYQLYDSMSKRLVECIRSENLLTRIEQYSIDEVFCQLPEFLNSYEDQLAVARQLRRTVWDHTRLPIGAGISTTFTLSKCASYIGKNVSGYRGICVINEESRNQLLSSVPVSEVWNVGRSKTLFLKRNGINTALDLSRVSTSKANDWFGITLERTVRELNNEVVYDFNSFPTIEGRKEISSSISLTVRATSEASLHQSLSERISIATEKLRAQGLTARQMIVFAQSSRFETSPKSFSANLLFEYPSDDTRVFLKGLSDSMGELYREHVDYYKIGCRLLGLEQTKHQQGDLFAPPAAPKLMSTVDGLNRRFGSRMITLGALKVENESGMLRKHLSPAYLTNWKDLPKIKC
ncbi:DUF4113 domain-containing protein [Vibrio sp. Y2-5]|uniref:Y-family DNA polymerase n=1 Tax=Vibrio sp. Y2-5 TaxID=2743977 RepID=UPI0016611768|nr:DUF4113 domain-containing protein [Vibrio sp. Y2-5]MBD0788116.1 DUF4113 domain-containing protein [Vibrio sp. Y2-5]